MNQYREEILEHWQNPQNYGKLEGDNVVIVEQINPLCGDEVVFFFKLEKKGNTKHVTRNAKIKDVSFEGKGCAISIAAASMFSEAIKGRKVNEVLRITGEDIFKLLGGPVTPARLKCAFLPLEVIKKLSVD